MEEPCEAAERPLVAGGPAAAPAEAKSELTALLKAETLREAVPHLHALLRLGGLPSTSEAKEELVVAEEYEYGPVVTKAAWEHLGSLVRVAEKPCSNNVPGDQWISLRLDGHGFSKVLPRLRKLGVLSNGFDPKLGAIMRACARAVMEEFQGVCAHTQSDELTVLIPPAPFDSRQGQRPHIYNGRVLKICTLASGKATAVLNRHLIPLYLAAGVDLDQLTDREFPHFDARLGHYGSFDEAASVLLWRAADCAMNGVSDAVYHAKLSGDKSAPVDAHTGAKLRWLSDRKMLPLDEHQAFGAVFRKVPVTKTAFNPKLNVEVTVVRPAVEQVKGNLLNHFARGDLVLWSG